MVNGGEYNNDDDDDENDGSTSGSVAAPTWESKLRTVDLEELSFQEGNRFMASKKIQLPEGTWRAQKKGMINMNAFWQRTIALCQGTIALCQGTIAFLSGNDCFLSGNDCFLSRTTAIVC